MTDRPILFSAPMINAMLAGRKTQTRRLIATTNADMAPGQIMLVEGPRFGGTAYRFAPRFTEGDRLYVREEWKSTPAYDDQKPSDMGGDNPIYYPADGATFNWADADGDRFGRRRPGMHMPRWASRLTLIVEAVRVERLQAISYEDAQAEGVERDGRLWKEYSGRPITACNERESYCSLWNSLHDKPGERWADDPFVVAVSFRVVRGNIDQVSA